MTFILGILTTLAVEAILFGLWALAFRAAVKTAIVGTVKKGGGGTGPY